jgi:hypothetical protein
MFMQALRRMDYASPPPLAKPAGASPSIWSSAGVIIISDEEHYWPLRFSYHALRERRLALNLNEIYHPHLRCTVERQLVGRASRHGS